MKAVPKIKVAKVEGEANDAEPIIDAKLVAKLEQLKGHLTTFFTDKANVENERLEGNGSLKDHIPAFALRKFELGFANFQQQRSHVDVAVETKIGDVKKITNEAKEAIKTMKASTENMKNYLNEAEEHLAAEGGG